jgi:hypothetical protein
MWQFRRDGLCIECYGWSMDREGRANVWNLFVTDPLQLVSAPPVDNGIID